MTTKAKTISTLLIVAVAVAGFAYSSSNKQLFQGNLLGDKTIVTSDTAEVLYPDLAGTLVVKVSKEGDLVAEASITNKGERAIAAGEPFRYSITVGDQEVLTNSDSYSSLEVGDSFSFDYPIPRAIYEYPEEGEVVFTVDIDDTIEELNEGNNVVVKEYKL